MRVRDFPHNLHVASLPHSYLNQVSTMEAKSQQAKGRDSVISLLNAAIDALNLAKEVSSFTPAKAVFGSASVLLTMIKVWLLFCDDLFQVNTWPGLNGQRTGARRPRVGLRRYL